MACIFLTWVVMVTNSCGWEVSIVKGSGRGVEPEVDECLEPRLTPENGWLWRVDVGMGRKSFSTNRIVHNGMDVSKRVEYSNVPDHDLLLGCC